MAERFRLEGSFKVIQLQPPFHGQGCHSLDPVAQGPIQYSFKYFPYGFLGNIFQCLTILGE